MFHQLVELGVFSYTEANRLQTTFDCMEIAEERIAYWKKHRVPTGELLRLRDQVVEAQERLQGKVRQRIVHETFLLLCVPDCLLRLPGDVYSAHCDELIKRVLTGGRRGHRKWSLPPLQELELATHAELLAAFTSTLGKVPLDDGHGTAYQHCFRYCLPEKWEMFLAEFETETFRESWQGQRDSIIANAQYRFRSPRRAKQFVSHFSQQGITA